MTNFHDLPSKLLTKIFDDLSFAEVSKLRGVSVDLRRAVRQHLNSAFLELGPRLMTRYTEYLILMKTDNESHVSGDAIFRGSLLRLLGSEHAILLALCRNYITNGKGCFTPGEILDLFIELQRNDFSIGIKNEEDKKLARLLLLIDQYLDWFERYRILTSEEHCSWYGTCIVDLLDSYLSSSYNLVATHDGQLVKFSGRYAINGQSEIPPKISEPLGGPITKKELLKIFRYLRKHVRWSNFITSFKSDRENFVEFEEDSEITTDKKLEGYQRTYRRRQSDFRDYEENAESLIVMVNLQCDRFNGPARLRGGFEEMKEWRRGIDYLKRGMKEKQKPSLARDLSMIGENLGSNSSLKSKFARLKSLRGGEPASSKETSELSQLYDKYALNLEIKSIYKIKNANSVETFGETMVHVDHTSEHTFAAQNECSLY